MQRRKERALSKCKTVLEALLYILKNKNMKHAVKLIVENQIHTQNSKYTNVIQRMQPT